MSLLDQLRSASKAPTRTIDANPAAEAAAPLPRIDASPVPTPPPPPDASRTRITVRNEALTELKSRVHEDLIHELDPQQLLGDTSFTSPARRAVEVAAEERIGQVDGTLGRQERLRLASEIADEVL